MAAQQLVQEQLDAGHIVPSNSPWNTPIFVIKKKSGKWRLLQDLRAVNKTMALMGALQPGLPSPVAIPLGFFKVIVDLKDCFFTIPLNPDDQRRFAFSLPAINFKAPMKRFQWHVLPQGMANSPALCQSFVASALQSVRDNWPNMYIIHYMDDILIAGEEGSEVLKCYEMMRIALRDKGLEIAPDKVQLADPYTYLGFQMRGSLISCQKLELKLDKLKTLNDFQKLLGDINWLMPYLKISKGELKPLYDILQGDANPTSPREFTLEGKQAIRKVKQAIHSQITTFMDYTKPLKFIICKTALSPTAVFWQTAPLMWIHLPATPKKVIEPYYQAVSNLIMMGRKQGKCYFGTEPDIIIQPYTVDQIRWLMQNTEFWPISLASYAGILDNHYPPDKLIDFANKHEFTFPTLTASKPLRNALLVFTDGSSTGRAAYTYLDQTVSFMTSSTSAQLTELQAIVAVFSTFPDQSLNIYTDSAYIAHSIPLLETAGQVKNISNAGNLFRQLQKLITKRVHPFYVGHLRAHSGLPGPLAEGNQKADLATRLQDSNQVFTTIDNSSDKITLAQNSHRLHHLNAKTLRLMHQITREQARQIVKNCPSCATHLPVPHLGVNPRGLIPNALWQMDVTHISEFGNLKYVHVIIDTFSGFIYASLQTGEATKHVISHMLTTFTVLGCPQQLKTDNGPGYTSSAFSEFCKRLNIQHITGIPYNPQGQGIVERAHLSLKITINK
uniref:Uncharacterized protein n=1 Tax=Molossus molossus TaxID=27622 RepID=A0A7J8GKY1_MOLMO|nr:hypothetical protein HJG59_011521 [Molossus molossus]